ncbi:hypothetical protein ABH944_008940 [Caballeronia udeis]|uniref:Uncharacterized protein n=1 Tax=Caballeronia udeis TaxID=1232866 RepID=A0ABW8MYN9_9BURK
MCVFLVKIVRWWLLAAVVATIGAMVSIKLFC